MEFFTTKQLAKILGVKTVTIRRWMAKGWIEGYKIGKELRIEKSDLSKFLAESRYKIQADDIKV